MSDQVPVFMPAFMEEVAGRVETRISAVLDSDADRWTALDPDLGVPLASLRRSVLGGGKRLRPAFCYWAFVGCGGPPDEPRIADAGAALELLHTCALIHDDVIDGSERRHGADTIHVEFERRHGGASWRGDSRHFGEGVAILVGDLAFVYADMLLGGVPAAARGVFNQLRLEVNIGQYLDLLGSAAGDASPERARRICQYKSAKYTVERPLHLGAAMADPDGLAAVAGPFSAYGLPLGEAFQLKDDLLGIFGDSAVTGKPVGDDLREGKPTLLLALARRASVGAAARILDERVGSADLTAGEVVSVQRIFEETGARAEVEATVDRLVDEALTAASALPVTEEARQALIALARFVAGRDR